MSSPFYTVPIFNMIYYVQVGWHDFILNLVTKNCKVHGACIHKQGFHNLSLA